MVMVCHAKNLAVPDVSKEEPNSYVKVYLLPDSAKATKRKTRVIHKNCHPSFMEMLEYRMPWEIVRSRTLQVCCLTPKQCSDVISEHRLPRGVSANLADFFNELDHVCSWCLLQ